MPQTPNNAPLLDWPPVPQLHPQSPIHTSIMPFPFKNQKCPYLKNLAAVNLLSLHLWGFLGVGGKLENLWTKITKKQWIGGWGGGVKYCFLNGTDTVLWIQIENLWNKTSGGGGDEEFWCSTNHERPPSPNPKPPQYHNPLDFKINLCSIFIVYQSFSEGGWWTLQMLIVTSCSKNSDQVKSWPIFLGKSQSKSVKTSNQSIHSLCKSEISLTLICNSPSPHYPYYNTPPPTMTSSSASSREDASCQEEAILMGSLKGSSN